MEKRQKPLSSAEQWDDSALLRSWDDALSEYKLYHSIHARGERVEDVLAEFEEKEKTDAEPGHGQLLNRNDSIHPSAGGQTNGHPSEELEEGEVETEVEDQLPASHSPHVNRPDDGIASDQPDPVSNMPHMIFSSVKDEALKNLMMSWYYAGYYTGLYEGQQQQSMNTISSAKKGADRAN
ncbi:hypothetical protein MMC07_004941 [Pseudocyphellaria aurata]|nr:hypothetical protein [Pseudocyphellaria aurata]